jgi:hypothetical protein
MEPENDCVNNLFLLTIHNNFLPSKLAVHYFECLVLLFSDVLVFVAIIPDLDSALLV